MEMRRDSARNSALISLPWALLLLGLACASARSGEPGDKPVNGARIANADAEPGNLAHLWPSRLLVFKLGGTAALPPLEPRAFVINPPPEPADAASIARGEPLYDQYCSACQGEHAVGGGVVADLRASNFLAIDFFYNMSSTARSRMREWRRLRPAETARKRIVRNT
jgi:cytochrome c1